MPLFSPPAPTPNPANVIAASGASQTLTAVGSIDPVYDITLNAACVLSLAAIPSPIVRRHVIEVWLRQDATAGRLATLPLANWAGGAPVLNTKAGYYDILQFATTDNGATWTGSVVGLGIMVVGAPSQPSISVVPGNGFNTITFADGATGGDAINGHYLAKGSAAGGEGAPVAVTLNSSNAYVDTAPNGTPVYYKGYNSNRVGMSPASAEMSGTPVAYTGPAHYLNITQTNGNAYTPASTSTDATDSYLDMRVWAALNSYTSSAGFASLISRYNPNVSPSGSFELYLLTTGALGVSYYDQGGTYRSAGTSVSTVASANPDPSSGIWMAGIVNLKSTSVTSTLMVGGSTVSGANSGGTAYVAAANTAAYFTSPDGITWTQLGATVTGLTGTGFKSLGTSSPALGFGGNDPTNTRNATPLGKFFKGLVRDSTKILANPDFTSLATGATSFTDTAATPNTYQLYQSSIA